MRSEHKIGDCLELKIRYDQATIGGTCHFEIGDIFIVWEIHPAIGSIFEEYGNIYELISLTGHSVYQFQTNVDSLFKPLVTP